MVLLLIGPTVGLYIILQSDDYFSSNDYISVSTVIYIFFNEINSLLWYYWEVHALIIIYLSDTSVIAAICVLVLLSFLLRFTMCG